MNRLLALLLILLLAACASPPARQYTASDSEMNDLLMYAMSLTDTEYRYGGKSANSGFDCSGYVGHVYRQTLGISLPRTASEISRVGAPVGRNELRPGDLVFYNTQGASYSHVGIYIGDGKFVHSPKTGDRVRTEQMHWKYWQTRYDGARRIVRSDY
ncbi:MAG: C40 family peptidase [Gammaproteobacteria bacterium]|nr:C40 family peptidase [Gammaproteobacteria bacterium]MBU1775416.1 C40 family peptidase [Gammaproteobacteria bacterium]MBU1969869.1 C40 family peptidase [Gammaproteobacteria bacterium]